MDSDYEDDIRLPDKQEIEDFIKSFYNNIGWNLKYNKNDIQIYTIVDEKSDLKKIKSKTTIKNFSKDVMFDVLMDNDFRIKWDKNLVKSKDCFSIDKNNDIGYFEVKSPIPFKNRDFVVHRSHKSFEDEFVIITKSISHKKIPYKRDVIRGISLLSGYFCTEKQAPENAIILYSIAHVHPMGNIPSWLINSVSTILLPEYINRLITKARCYTKWKYKHCPEVKPWLHFDQSLLPNVDMEDVSLPKYFKNKENITKNTSQSTISDESIDGLADTDSAHMKFIEKYKTENFN
ncbi:hypothetical protein A3Q56_02739 [Intoshia linei]|uniref:START domain-containing protein n=1 Tax=Intoshia linei TaxID=1819745 RepID=A0A177B7T3_9BILA|nr:hypothetical protein A3Q56_02739 [Intoshia linei]